MIEVDFLWNHRDQVLLMLLVLHCTYEFVLDYMDGLCLIVWTGVFFKELQRQAEEEDDNRLIRRLRGELEVKSELH